MSFSLPPHLLLLAPADSFDCGDNCVQSPASVMMVDPDAPNAVDQIVGGPAEPTVSPGSALAQEDAASAGAGDASVRVVDPDAPSAGRVGRGGGGAAATQVAKGPVAEGGKVPVSPAKKSAPQGLDMLPMSLMGRRGVVIRQRQGPAGMSGSSGPAPI